MNKKWIKIWLPENFPIDFCRKWCNENCYYKFKIKNPKIPKKPKIKFERIEDAMAFKLRWL